MEKVWKRKNICCVQSCNEYMCHSSRLGSNEDLLPSLFLAARLQCKTQSIPVPTPLCKHHYHLLYNTYLPTQTNCITCGISLKHAKPRPCPDPTAIQGYLKINTGFDSEILPTDKVCNTCYKAHLTMLQEIRTISTDSDLKHLIKTYSQQKAKVSQSLVC